MFRLTESKQRGWWPLTGLLLWVALAAALAGALLAPSHAAASSGNRAAGGDTVLEGRVSLQGEDVFLHGDGLHVVITPTFASAPVEPQDLPDVFLGNQEGLRQPTFASAPVDPQALRDVFLGNYDASRIASNMLPLGGICGDQNDDRLVNVLDVIIDLQITVGRVRATLPHRVLSDLNGDLRVNVFDAIIALRHIVGSLEIGRRCGPLPG